MDDTKPARDVKTFVLEKNFSIFLTAAVLKEKTKRDWAPDGSSWAPINGKPDESLAPDVALFLTGCLSPEAEPADMADRQCQAYTLKDNNDRMLTERWILARGDSEYPFRFYKNFGVRLYVFPSTRVVILAFGVQVLGKKGPNPQIEDLLGFNHTFRIESRWKPEHVPTVQLDSWTIEDKRDHEAVEERMRNPCQVISLQGLTQPEEVEQKPAGEAGWVRKHHVYAVHEFVQCFLSGLPVCQLNPLWSGRMRAFTYAYCAQAPQLDEMGIRKVMFRLRRLYDEGYVPPMDDLKAVDSGEVIRPFETIWMGASIEGVGILVWPPGGVVRRKFFEGYDTRPVLTAIFPLFLLAFQIRAAMEYATAQMSCKMLRSGACYSELKCPAVTEHIRDMRSRFMELRMQTTFPQVSDTTQHNQFFELCHKAFGIDKLATEVAEDIEDMHRHSEERSQRAIKIVAFVTTIWGVISIGMAVMKEFCGMTLSVDKDNWLAACITGGMAVAVGVLLWYFGFHRD